MTKTRGLLVSIKQKQGEKIFRKKIHTPHNQESIIPNHAEFSLELKIEMGESSKARKFLSYFLVPSPDGLPPRINQGKQEATQTANTNGT